RPPGPTTTPRHTSSGRATSKVAGTSSRVMSNAPHRSGGRLAGQLPECLTGDPEGGPVVERHGAERLVESDGGFIPVEHRPFESAALALQRDRGQPFEQGAADSGAAGLRQHEE